MGFKDYVELSDFVKGLDATWEQAYYRLNKAIRNGVLSEKDLFRLRRDARKEYLKEKDKKVLNGYMVISIEAREFLLSIFDKKIIAEETITSIEKPAVINDAILNDVIVNDDLSRQIELNKKALIAIGFGEAIAAVHALNAIEEGIDIVTYAQRALRESKERRDDFKREMLSKGFKRLGRALEEKGFDNPYKVACVEYKKKFFIATGYDLSLLDKKEKGMLYTFISEFNLWESAFKVLNDYENSIHGGVI